MVDAPARQGNPAATIRWAPSPEGGPIRNGRPRGNSATCALLAVVWSDDERKSVRRETPRISTLTHFFEWHILPPITRVTSRRRASNSSSAVGSRETKQERNPAQRRARQVKRTTEARVVGPAWEECSGALLRAARSDVGMDAGGRFRMTPPPSRRGAQGCVAARRPIAPGTTTKS
jgi:hypothetical protein